MSNLLLERWSKLAGLLLEKSPNDRDDVRQAWADLNGNRFGCILWEFVIGEHFGISKGTEISVQGKQESKTITINYTESPDHPRAGLTPRQNQPTGSAPQTNQASKTIPEGRNPPDIRMIPFLGGDLNNFVELMRFNLQQKSFPKEMYGDEAIYFEAGTAHTDICIMRKGKLQCQIHAKWNVGKQTRTIGTSAERGGIPEKDQGMQNIIDPDLVLDYLDGIQFDERGYETSVTSRLNLSARSGAQARKERVGGRGSSFEMSEYADVLEHYLEILNSSEGKADFAKYYSTRFDDEIFGGSTYFIYGSVPKISELEAGTSSGTRVSGEYRDQMLNKVKIDFQKMDGPAVSKIIKQSDFQQRGDQKSVDMIHPQYGLLCNFQIRARESSSATGRPPQEREGVALRGLTNAQALSKDPNASYDDVTQAMDELLSAMEVAQGDKAKGEMYRMYVALQNKLSLLERKKYSLKENLFYNLGLELLKEDSPSISRASIPSGTITVNNVDLNAADFAQIQTSADVYSMLPIGSGANATGWRTQKKVAAWLIKEGFKIKWIASGSNQPDVLAEKGGILYSFEVGRPTKRTQLGNVSSSHKLARTSKTAQGVIEKQRAIGASKLRGTTAGSHKDFTDAEMDMGFESEKRISLGQTGTYWKADKSDILIMIVENGKDEPEPNCEIYMIALSKEGNDLSQAENWGLRTYANVVNTAYGVHRSLGKSGDITMANQGGGSWSTKTASGKRAGFDPFPKRIKDSMVKVN
tara:strand:- start:265 stop:2523 length:2259 start_codon:yes stop_codon:yes gene_type:complete